MKRVETKDIFPLLTMFLFAHLNCLVEGGKNYILSPLVQSLNILILVSEVNIRAEMNEFDIFSLLMMFLFALIGVKKNLYSFPLSQIYSHSGVAGGKNMNSVLTSVSDPDPH